MKTALVVAALIGFAVPALAQDRNQNTTSNSRGTSADERACGPDARKLCRSVMSDDMAVLRCFQANRKKLSRACREVLERYGQ